MAELIEKSAVLAMIDAFAEENRNHGFSGIDIFDIEMMKMRIEQMTAADVAPVVHGHWDDGLDGITPFCSVCGRSHHTVIRTPNYCPNCGAKMGEEVNDT